MARSIVTIYSSKNIYTLAKIGGNFYQLLDILGGNFNHPPIHFRGTTITNTPLPIPLAR